jgi:predicted NBD/HSP70 family sugar kinase
VKKEASDREKIKAFMQDFNNLVRAIKNVSGGNPAFISIIVAGPVSADRTMILAAGNIVHWTGRSFVGMLEQAFPQCRVILGNDAEGAALAEALYGHGKEQDFLLVVMGTGVGGCRIHWEGTQCAALPTELGHQRMAAAMTTA